MLGIAALAAVTFVLVSGCGGSEEDTPERSIRSFLGALRDRDGESACGELTADGRKELERFLPLFAPGVSARTCVEIVKSARVQVAPDTKVHDVRVQGAKATAIVDGGPNMVRLVRNDGNWQIAEQFRGGWRSFGIPRYPPGAEPPPAGS